MVFLFLQIHVGIVWKFHIFSAFPICSEKSIAQNIYSNKKKLIKYT